MHGVLLSLTLRAIRAILPPVLSEGLVKFIPTKEL